MREHELKTWPSFFKAIRDGSKTFEVRRADRDFAVGDCLILKEWDPGQQIGSLSDYAGYTGEALRVRVTYLMPGGKFGIDPAYCVMGIEVAEPVPTGAIASGSKAC